MTIRPVKEEDLPSLLALYNGAAGERALFLKMKKEDFSSSFLPIRPGLHPVCLTAEEDGKLLGFAAGSIADGAKYGYITCVLTHKDRSGVGKPLLDALEKALISIGRPEKLRIIFYNPVNLPWTVPETDGAIHPGMPGVDIGSRAYVWFQNRGYRNYTFFGAYYKKLKDGEEFTPRVKERIEQNAARGLEVTFYDREKHGSFLPLIEALGSEGWRAEILHNEAREHPLPMAVAVDMSEEARAKNGGKGFVCGFAGPLYRQDCGRGYFGGIGIHPAYRKCGLGTTLFAFLCRGLCSIGADYMTLFTGEDGVARTIYEYAGFRVSRGFAAMDKIVKAEK